MAPCLARKEVGVISEGHPFDDAQGRLPDTRPFGRQDRRRATPLCAPLTYQPVIVGSGQRGGHGVAHLLGRRRSAQVGGQRLTQLNDPERRFLDRDRSRLLAQMTHHHGPR